MGSIPVGSTKNGLICFQIKPFLIYNFYSSYILIKLVLYLETVKVKFEFILRRKAGVAQISALVRPFF